MNVSLKPELQRFVEEQIKTGRFASAEEVLEAGVARLMLDSAPEEIDDETWAAIERAEAQIDRGEGIPLNEAFERLRKKHLGT